MKLKVGDRVAVYALDGSMNKIREVGTVTGFSHQGTVYLDGVTGFSDHKGYDLTVVHPKQCRLLKKLRRIWVPKRVGSELQEATQDDNAWHEYLDCRPPISIAQKFIEFVEVKK